jgi:hypothetical protein
VDLGEHPEYWSCFFVAICNGVLVYRRTVEPAQVAAHDLWTGEKLWEMPDDPRVFRSAFKNPRKKPPNRRTPPPKPAVSVLPGGGTLTRIDVPWADGDKQGLVSCVGRGDRLDGLDRPYGKNRRTVWSFRDAEVVECRCARQYVVVNGAERTPERTWVWASIEHPSGVVHRLPLGTQSIGQGKVSLARDTIYASTPGSIIAFRYTGEKLWEAALEGLPQAHSLLPVPWGLYAVCGTDRKPLTVIALGATNPASASRTRKRAT